MIKKLTADDGKFYFVVCARNGKVLVTSETYNTKRAREKGITSLLRSIAFYA